MKLTECENCAFSEQLKEKRVIRSGDMVLVQGKGTIICHCHDITSMTITDGGMICSSFRGREVSGDGCEPV